jgi:hypothetical protein
VALPEPRRTFRLDTEADELHLGINVIIAAADPF